MIPREHILKFLIVAALLNLIQSESSRTYDTGEWIPITNKCPTCQETNSEEPAIEKRAAGRVLNVEETLPNRNKFFPEEQTIRSKKSNRVNVEQYLREVSSPSRKLPKRQHEVLQQPLDGHGLPPEIQQQLNQGEFVNHQYFRQRPFQEPQPLREYQKQPQQVPQQVQLTQSLPQQNPQLLSPQVVLPQGQNYFQSQNLLPRPLFDIPLLPENLNIFQTNYQNVAATPQRQSNTVINKSYESLNPGVQAINQGLAGDTLSSSNNNYKDFKQVTVTSTSPKTISEKETVQLLYVPVESLNQRQPQKQETLLPQQQLLQEQEAVLRRAQQFEAQVEQRQKAEQLRIQQEQQLKAQQETRLKVEQERQLKAEQEASAKAQQEAQAKAQHEAQLNQQRADQIFKAQQAEAALNQQLQQQALSQVQQLPIQHEHTLLLHQVRPSQQLQPIQQLELTQQLPSVQHAQVPQQLQPAIQLTDQAPRRRRPTHPPARQQYETRVSTVKNEAPAQHRQSQFQAIQNDFAQQALSALKLQLQLQEQATPTLISQTVSTTTSSPVTQPTPKKRKPHQPPLAVYMEANGDVTVTDVLNLLKTAKTISVQDAVGPNSPQVFVGPHNLEPPEGYAKFELPYLSSIENNRVERKVDQLPFFVAPLSYKTPPGYSKIPLPAPHVGSVVVSQKDQLREKHTRQQPAYRIENLLTESPFHLSNPHAYLLEQPQQPIKPFRLENAINEEPYRLPTQPQTILNPFSTPLPNPTTPLNPVTSRPDLLGQTINQFELEQINQFLPQPQVQPQAEYQSSQVDDVEPNEYQQVVTQRQHLRKGNRVVSTTPVVPSAPTITEFSREIQSSTRRPELRSRSRPTQKTTVVSTQSNIDKQKYTVLEEFSARQRPVTSTLTNFEESAVIASTPVAESLSLQSRRQQAAQATAERLPSSTPLPLSILPQNVNQLLPSSVSQLVPQPDPRVTQPTHQSQQFLGEQLLQSVDPNAEGVQTYFQIDSNGNYIPVQNVDANANKFVHQQDFEQEFQTFRSGSSTTQSTLAVKEEVISTTPRLIERLAEKSTRSSARSNARTRGRGRTQYVPEVYESAEEKNQGENYKLPTDLPSIQPEIHSLINDLQDKSIRPLLVPASIAPTTEHASRAHLQQQRQHLAGISPVEQLEQELATQPPVQHQQEQQQHQQLVSQQIQQLEQQFRSEAPVDQQQQFISQASILPQQYLSQSPLEQFQQELSTEPPASSPQHQQQQQFVTQHVQQLEEQFRAQAPEQQFISPSPIQQPEQQYVLVSSTEAVVEPLTTPNPSSASYTSTTAASIETTTTNRGRQRGRQRARVSTTTTSSASGRRNAQRTRKPTSRSKTDINRYQQELEDYVDYTPVRATERRQQELDYATESVRRTTSRQRTRTKSRTQEVPQLTERTINTNIAEENSVRQPQFQSVNLQPQSYMQFEQPFDVVSDNEPPVKFQSVAERNQILREYQPVYSTEGQQSISSTETLVSKQVPAEHQKLSVDVLITHPITETVTKESLAAVQPNGEYVPFSSNVEQPRGRLQQNQEIEVPVAIIQQTPKIIEQPVGRVPHRQEIVEQPVVRIPQRQVIIEQPITRQRQEIIEQPIIRQRQEIIEQPVVRHRHELVEQPVVRQRQEIVEPINRQRPEVIAQPVSRVQQKQEDEPRTRAPQTRQRGRGRGRSRVTTTAKPVSMTTTPASSRIKTVPKEDDEEEFYGFIRAPNYNRPPASEYRAKEQVTEPKLFSATYVGSTGKPLRSNSIAPQYEDQPPETSNTVPIYSKNSITTTPRVFVGKIRPKFHPHAAKHEESVEVTTETVTTERRYTARPSKPAFTPKPRIRGGRTRPSGRKPQTTEVPITTTQRTRVPPSQAKGHRFKPRGTSAFQLPASLKAAQSDDEDVEGGNYPAPFLKAQEELTERPKFQITIDPGLEEVPSEEDQEPYSSIYRPKIIRQDGEDMSQTRESVELFSVQNNIPIDRKNVESQEHFSASFETSTTVRSVQEKNDKDVIKSILEEIIGDVEESRENDEFSSSTLPSPAKDTNSKEIDSENSSANDNGKPKNRRRGMWRLVKRPVDTFETAESQYVGSVIANSFVFNEKKEPKKIYSVDHQQYVEATNNENKTTTTSKNTETKLEIEKTTHSQTNGITTLPSVSSTKQDNFFESLYNMFGIENVPEETNQEAKPGAVENESTTSTPQFTEGTTELGIMKIFPPIVINHTIPDHINKLKELKNDLQNASNQSEEVKSPEVQQEVRSTTELPLPTVDPSVATQQSQISETLDPKLDPWDFEVKTSTSTEISHETEICYRGKCVKASGTKIPTLQ